MDAELAQPFLYPLQVPPELFPRPRLPALPLPLVRIVVECEFLTLNSQSDLEQGDPLNANLIIHYNGQSILNQAQHSSARPEAGGQEHPDAVHGNLM